MRKQMAEENVSLIDWSIRLLEEIEVSPEKQEWCRTYSVYTSNPGQEELHHNLHVFVKRAYENGVVISNYQVLYIGKADGKKGLRQRLKQYMNYGWNNATNHKGGRAIWQIENAGLLLLAYEECEDASAREKQLLADYKAENGSYPLANWRG